MTSNPRLAVVVTVINLVLLVFILTQYRSAVAQGDASVLRGRGLELVDATGQVRAQFNVEPDGEAVFRMRDASGTIRVKLGAGAEGPALLLLDETTEPGVQILARRTPTASHPATTNKRIAAAPPLPALEIDQRGECDLVSHCRPGGAATWRTARPRGATPKRHSRMGSLSGRDRNQLQKAHCVVVEDVSLFRGRHPVQAKRVGSMR
jgi:hypothetical protein